MSGDLLIKNARQMLTMAGEDNDDLGLLQRGWLWAVDGVIRAVGGEEQILPLLTSNPERVVIDAAGKTVLPGFVDCHTHVVFGRSRVEEYALKVTGADPAILKEQGLPVGIYASMEMTRATPAEALYAQTAKRLANMIVHGATTVESKSGYGLSLESELTMLRLNRQLAANLPLDIPSTFLGAHGWPPDMAKEDYIRLLIDQIYPAVAEEKLAEYCDIWVDEGYYTAEEARLILGTGASYGLIPRIHADAYSYVGGSDLAAEMGMCSADHLNYTPPAVLAKLAAANVVGVVLPGIEFAVNHPRPFDPKPMWEAGMTLALATNCCPGVWAESMQFILILASRVYGFSAAQAIRAATWGGAQALRMTDRGRLAPGLLADIQIWDVDTYEDVIYKYGRNNVETVIKRGRIVAEKGALTPCHSTDKSVHHVPIGTIVEGVSVAEESLT